MRKITVFYFLIPLLFLNIAGCAPLIIGAAAGGLGAYAISRDTIQAETDKSYEGLWNSALTVGGIRGAITQQDYSMGYIELKTDSGRVWIRLVRLTRATVRLRVSARKHRLPNLALAQDIFLKIMEEAR